MLVIVLFCLFIYFFFFVINLSVFRFYNGISIMVLIGVSYTSGYTIYIKITRNKITLNSCLNYEVFATDPFAQRCNHYKYFQKCFTYVCKNEHKHYDSTTPVIGLYGQGTINMMSYVGSFISLTQDPMFVDSPHM